MLQKELMMEEHKDKPAEIFIDKKKHESPEHTNGHALYTLGAVDATAYDLYLEVHKGDDELVADTTTSLTVKNGEHFFTVQKKLNPGGLWA
jgi:hypothetical protein